MAIEKSRYGLTDAQYNACYDFFAINKSSNGLLKVKFVHLLLKETIKTRNGQVKANESDIKRLLNTFDEDKDGYLEFDQFIGLLNLTFANKRNLSKRIEQYLNDKNSESMSPENASKHLHFLNTFYSPDASKLAEAYSSNSGNDIFKLLNTIIFDKNTQHSSTLIMNTTRPTKNKEFAHQLAKYYESSLFL